MDVNWNYDPHREETHEDHDVAFLKVTNGTLKIFPRGWYRDAVIEVNKERKGKYFIQRTKSRSCSCIQSLLNQAEDIKSNVI